MKKLILIAVLLFPLSIMGQNTGQHFINHNELWQSPSFAFLRYDGLYRSSDETADYCLRFYKDGAVLAVSLAKNADLEEVAKWFNKSHPRSSKGAYKAKGEKITFSTTIVFLEGSERREVTVDYSGIIENDCSTLTLETYSHFNGNRGKRQYKFVEMKLSEP